MSKNANNKELWKIIFDRECLPYFDETKCKKYHGDPGKVHQISWPRAYQFFNCDCKLFLGKKIKETHKLQLFYKEINGIEMTLNHVKILSKNLEAKNKGNVPFFDDFVGEDAFKAYGEAPLSKSFWGFAAIKSLEGSSDWLVEEIEAHKMLSSISPPQAS